MKKSKFPTKIKILDQIYSVNYVDRLSDVSSETKAVGHIDTHKKIIDVFKPKNCNESDVWNTIIHESLHAIVETLRIEEISNLEEKNLETVIHLLATGINTLMIDNKLCFRDVKI